MASGRDHIAVVKRDVDVAAAALLRGFTSDDWGMTGRNSLPTRDSIDNIKDSNGAHQSAPANSWCCLVVSAVTAVDTIAATERMVLGTAHIKPTKLWYLDPSLWHSYQPDRKSLLPLVSNRYCTSTQRIAITMTHYSYYMTPAAWPQRLTERNITPLQQHNIFH